MSDLARAYIQSGEKAEAHKLIDELKRQYKESDIGNIALDLSYIYIDLGEKDQALEWLERSYEKRDPRLIALNTNQISDPICQDPRFKTIQVKMGLPPPPPQKTRFHGPPS